MPQPAAQVRTDSVSLRPNHVRSLALAGAVVGVVLLPIAAAQATPSQGSSLPGTAGASAAAPGAAGTPSAVAQAVAAEFCGPARTAAVTGGTLRVQACVEQTPGAASARVYVVNQTDAAQTAVLDLTGADGGVVQVQCTITAGNGTGMCETGPVQLTAAASSLDAIAEVVEQGAPVSAGVVHVESGLVAPAAR